MVRKMLFGAVLVLALFATPAAAQYRPPVVTPTTVPPGGDVDVSGSGCSSGAEVTITITPVTSTRAVAPIATTTVIADENGNFSTTITIPPGTPDGTYRVSATCDGQEVLGELIEVVGGSVTPTTTPGTDDGTIVRTGSDLNGLGIAGAAMLGIGGAILLATRSRRHRTV